MKLGLLAPLVKIEGAELSDTWMNALVDMRVELGFRVAGRCTLRFADPHYELSSDSVVKLGAKVEVFARDSGPLISGDITGVSIDHRTGHAPEFIVVVHDKAYALSRATKVATYTKLKHSDIVRKIAGDCGLTASVDPTPVVVEYTLQVDSDLAVLDALADRTGYDWWIEGTALNFKKPAEGTVIELRLVDDLLAFSVRASGLHADSVRVEGWDRGQQRAVTGEVTAGGARLQPDAKLVKDFVSPGGKLNGSAEHLSAGLAATTSDEAKQLSEAMRDRAVASAVTARGVLLGDPRIKPGVCVRVTEAGPLAGKYHVTQVEHIFSADGFETRFTAGERRPTSLVDTLAGGTAGAISAGSVRSTMQHTGLVVGQVTNIKDDKNGGRVKVRYPGLAPQQESDWARVLILGAGKERGIAFLPEVGDEVLVGFEGGDLRQPVVLGGLYGSKSTIPRVEFQDGKLKARRVTSRLGHYVELGDGGGDTEQHVLLGLKGDKSRLRLGKDKVDLEVPSGVPVALKSGNSSITIGKDGSITIKGSKIVIEAEQTITATANSKVEVKGSAGVTVESNGQTVVKGAILDVQSSGITEIKGSLVKIN